MNNIFANRTETGVVENRMQPQRLQTKARAKKGASVLRRCARGIANCRLTKLRMGAVAKRLISRAFALAERRRAVFVSWSLFCVV
jgi:hypothetical protein